MGFVCAGVVAPSRTPQPPQNSSPRLVREAAGRAGERQRGAALRAEAAALAVLVLAPRALHDQSARVGSIGRAIASARMSSP